MKGGIETVHHVKLNIMALGKKLVGGGLEKTKTKMGRWGEICRSTSQVKGGQRREKKNRANRRTVYTKKGKKRFHGGPKAEKQMISVWERMKEGGWEEKGVVGVVSWGGELQ